MLRSPQCITQTNNRYTPQRCNWYLYIAKWLLFLLVSSVTVMLTCILIGSFPLILELLKLKNKLSIYYKVITHIKHVYIMYQFCTQIRSVFLFQILLIKRMNSLRGKLNKKNEGRKLCLC